MNYAPVYITLGDRPLPILKRIEGLGASKKQTDETYNRRKWIPWLLFLAGIPFLCVDLASMALGYPFLGMTCIMGVCWLAALAMGLNLRKIRMADFHPDLKTSYEVIRTLRDDLQPKSVFLGHIDLTGAEQEKKILRENKDARGRVTKLYSDEWLRLKAKLYDGNVLRVSVSHKIKKRDSYWGRGRSGKSKLKPAKTKGNFNELNVRIAVNPELYEIVPSPEIQNGATIGPYYVQSIDTNGGMVTLICATSKLQNAPGDILSVLQAGYTLLKRKR
jgi:hypothetical protein